MKRTILLYKLTLLLKITLNTLIYNLKKASQKTYFFSKITNFYHLIGNYTKLSKLCMFHV